MDIKVLGGSDAHQGNYKQICKEKSSCISFYQVSGREISKLTTRRNRKKSETMDDLIGRATSGRVFKQITEYACGRRGTASKLLKGSRASCIIEDAEEELLPLIVDSIDAPRIVHGAESVFGPPKSETPPQFDYSSVKEGASNHNNFPDNLPHLEDVNYASTAGKPPLTARYPEVFTFVGKDSELSTCVSLTKAMVYDFNSVF
jgi:hypothetical protein